MAQELYPLDQLDQRPVLRPHRRLSLSYDAVFIEMKHTGTMFWYKDEPLRNLSQA